MKEGRDKLKMFLDTSDFGILQTTEERTDISTVKTICVKGF
jgi:hypothetical protein